MREAWNTPGLEHDEGMNIGPDRVDLAGLKPVEEKFIAATRKHVAAVTAPWWKRAITGVIGIGEVGTADKGEATVTRGRE